MATSEEDEEWIPAFEAAKLAIRKFGGLTRAQRALATALREGMLRAAVTSSTIAEDGDDYVEEQAPRGELLEVPVEAWLASDNWESDRLSWDWLAGEFEVEGHEFGVHYLFHDVHFLRSETESLDSANLPLSDTAGVAPAASKRRGPKPSMRWAALIEAVLALERDGELVTGRFSGPGELRGAIQGRIPPDQLLEDRTIEAVVAYIYERLLFSKLA